MHVFELRAQLSENDIAALVHAFYRRVQTDPLLGPVFARRIAQDAWPAHLDKMCAFWSSTLLATNRYHGNPMTAHATIEGLTPARFRRWLRLFACVAGELLERPVAAAVLQRARRMGAALQRNAAG